MEPTVSRNQSHPTAKLMLNVGRVQPDVMVDDMCVRIFRRRSESFGGSILPLIQRYGRDWCRMGNVPMLVQRSNGE